MKRTYLLSCQSSYLLSKELEKFLNDGWHVLKIFDFKRDSSSWDNGVYEALLINCETNVSNKTQ